MNDTAYWEAQHKDRHWGVYPDIYMVRQVKRFMSQWTGLHRPMALDIGCGVGANAWMMQREGMDVTAFDASPTAIERMRNAGMDGIVGDERTIDFPPASFDFIMDNLTLTNIEHPRWGNILSWLRPKGCLVYATFNVAPPGIPPTWHHTAIGVQVEAQENRRGDGTWTSITVMRYVLDGHLNANSRA